MFYDLCVAPCAESPLLFTDIYFTFNVSKRTTTDCEGYPACLALFYIKKDIFLHHTQIFYIIISYLWGVSWLRVPYFSTAQSQPWDFSCPVSLTSVLLTDCKSVQFFTYCDHETQTGSKIQRKTTREYFLHLGVRQRDMKAECWVVPGIFLCFSVSLNFYQSYSVFWAKHPLHP